MEIAYILMLMSAAMGDLKVFSVSQTRMMKAISLFIVVMAAAYLFISGRLERVKNGGKLCRCLRLCPYRNYRMVDIFVDNQH